MTSPRRIHQFVHTLSYGDAISGEVLALSRCFRELGWESEIFAINIHPKYKQLARDYRQLGNDYDGEIILHYSLGSPLNERYLSLRQARHILIYHNLTPARWFAATNPRIVSDIERGVRELPDLCLATEVLIADSPFNANELRVLGFEAQVLELPIDPERWNVDPNPGIAALLAGQPGIHVLHVGRLAPNKCIEDIIRIFYFLHHYVEPKSHLWLPGIDIDTELYSFALKRLVYQLELTDAVTFPGCMADSELKALYQAASLYLCTSEHEGFCLPVAEAMYFGVPVVAYDCSATSSTVGEGGILFKDKNSRYAEVAELIGAIKQNTDLRAQIIQAGHERVEKLSFPRFKESVERVFA